MAIELTPLALFMSLSASSPSLPAVVDAEGWVELGGSKSKGRSSAFQTGRVDSHELHFHAGIDGFSALPSDIMGGDFRHLTLPSQQHCDVIGAPDVPLYRRLFAIPCGTRDITVEVVDLELVELSDALVDPKQTPRKDCAPASFHRGLDFDAELYSHDAMFPLEWAYADSVGSYHGVPFGAVEIYPVRYNPARQTLHIARVLDVVVRFERDAAASTHSCRRQHRAARHLKASNTTTWVNPPELQSATKHAHHSGVDYLILAARPFAASPSLQRLADFHRNVHGLNVEVVDLSDVGNSPSEIKARIQEEYDREKPPSLDYVLLVGELSDIPFRDKDKYQSDIWYAWLDGNDIIGDVGLGRFPAENEQLLSRMVDKTIRFHSNEDSGAWREKVTLVAHHEDYPDKYTDCSESIRKADYEPRAPEFDTKYGGDRNPRWSNRDIVDAINEGRLIVNYRGHGKEGSWSEWNGDSFDKNDVKSLENGTRTPVVISVACSNSNMRREDDTISEVFLEHEFGAVAFLGASARSDTKENHIFNRALFRGAWREGVNRIGDLLNWANMRLYESKGRDATDNISMYFWLGDPYVAIGPDVDPPALTIGAIALEGSAEDIGDATSSGATFVSSEGTDLRVTPSGAWKLATDSAPSQGPTIISSSDPAGNTISITLTVTTDGRSDN